MLSAPVPVSVFSSAGILDDRGELADGPDTLENALLVEERARRKARDAAHKKAKPLWEEDGKVRGCSAVVFDIENGACAWGETAQLG